MKPDGLVTVLGEACVNGKAAESTEHLVVFSHLYRHYAIATKIAELPVHVCGIFATFSLVNHYICC